MNERFQIHIGSNVTKFTEISEGACDNPADDGLFIVVRSLESY